MEKIQQALAKARADRQVVLGEPPAMPAPSAAGGLTGMRDRGSLVPLRQVGRPGLAQHRIVAALGRSPAAEAFRLLRTHVQGRLDALGGRTLAVSSPRQGDGKTVVAINLAIAIAQAVDRSAVLVDLDLRQPAVARYLGLSVEHGVAEHLMGQQPLDACLVRPGIEDLVVLPQRQSQPRSSELLASQAMIRLAQELKARFPDRVIVYDCPPLLATDDPLIVKGLVDGVLLVVQDGVTTKGDLQRASQLIGEDAFLGSVVNRSSWSLSAGYHY